MSCQGTICWQSYNKCEWNEELRSLQRFIGEPFWEQISLKNSHVPVDMVCLMLYLLFTEMSQQSEDLQQTFSRQTEELQKELLKCVQSVAEAYDK